MRRSPERKMGGGQSYSSVCSSRCASNRSSGRARPRSIDHLPDVRMRIRRRTSMKVADGASAVVLSLSVLLVPVPTSAVVLEHQPSKTGAHDIMLIARGERMELHDFYTGLPADAPSLESRPVRVGGSLHWMQVSEETDDLGILHVVHQQYLTHPSLAATPLANGVPLAGGRLTFQYSRHGVLISVDGGSFADISSIGTVGATTVADARALAASVYQVTTHSSVLSDGLLDSEAIARSERRTKLWLRSTGDGQAFEFVWNTLLYLEDGGPVAAAVDSGTGYLYASWDPNPADDPCEANSDTLVQAYGRPQRPDIAPMYLWATPSGGYDAPFTHQAHKPPSGLKPRIEIYMGTPSWDGCPGGNLQWYQILPILTGLAPNYNDWHAGQSVPPNDDPVPYDVPGKAGADALRKTNETMAVLAEFDRNSFDNQGTPARVGVACYGASSDSAGWLEEFSTSKFIPVESVCIGRNVALPYSLAAALDVIAHEFGHGLMLSLPNIWEYRSYDDGGALHEGFADVFGYIVEQKTHPFDDTPGTNDPEEADWHFGEDAWPACNDWRRSAEANDVVGSGESYHVNDPWGGAGCDYAHCVGHRLGVAFMLATAGGLNPACGTFNPFRDECSIPGVPPLGIEKASKIFYRLMTMEVDSETGWEHLAYLAKRAAHAEYSRPGVVNCSDGLEEQLSVHYAFKSIGLEPAEEWVCFCPGRCIPPYPW